MDQPIIEINNLSKSYILRHKLPYQTFRDAIINTIRKPWALISGKNKASRENFWALHNINLKLFKGQKIGVIGRNGAGKSTLLKVLSQITHPTTGEIILRGRVASLLEVGTGFHPELTGRENIYLNGAILGMSRTEIADKFNDIVNFADIEQFLDTPVKRYSSGMYVRLAFAIAAHLEPEILIVDEVLAVGDIQFQKKCLGKMHSISESGRTIIFVSHNLGAIKQLCNYCVLLDHGQQITQGTPDHVISAYMANRSDEKNIFIQAPDPSKKMNLRKVELDPSHHRDGNDVYFSKDIFLRIEYDIHTPISNALVWILLQNFDGITIFNSADYDNNPSLKDVRQPGHYVATVRIPNKMLNIGSYTVTLGLNTNNIDLEVFDRVETISFHIIDDGKTPSAQNNESNRSGALQPLLDWETKLK